VLSLTIHLKRKKKKMSSEKIDKIHIKIGDRDLGVIKVGKGLGLSDKQLAEMFWNAVLSNVIVYHKGVTAQITVSTLGGEYHVRFKVKQPFVFHGFKNNKVYVTIPVTLDTLKGLGFISKKKG